MKGFISSSEAMPFGSWYIVYSIRNRNPIGSYTSKSFESWTYIEAQFLNLGVFWLTMYKYFKTVWSGHRYAEIRKIRVKHNWQSVFPTSNINKLI